MHSSHHLQVWRSRISAPVLQMTGACAGLVVFFAFRALQSTGFVLATVMREPAPAGPHV